MKPTTPLKSTGDGDPGQATGLNLRRRSFVVGVPAAFAGLAAAPGAFAISRQDFNASASWAASPVSAAPAGSNQINNQTIRNIVHVSLGGDSIRVKLSNRYGTAPLRIEAAAVGIATANGQIAPGSSRPLRFSGRTFFNIPALSELVSDWLPWNVPALSELAIDIHIAVNTSAGTSPLTLHNARPAGQNLSWLAAGNQAGANDFQTVATRTQWYFLTGVDVSNARSPGSIACFGDSITDGSQSTLYANARYPDFLAQRVLQASPGAPMGVVNLGIGGNQVLTGGTGDPAVARFDRDVLAQAGVFNIIVLEGINDISGGATAQRVIEGHRQLIVRAHAKRKKIYGSTITPNGTASDQREAVRQAVNAWMRSDSGYDAVIDFDAVVRDPANPRLVLAAYDSGDQLHPNSVGYQAMANAVPLGLFAGPRPRLF